jgi:hypothetical protein
VTERDGVTFRGEITLQTKGDPITAKVSGKAGLKAAGKVVFETEQQGEFKQRFEGKFADGKMDLTYSGTAPSGRPVSGTATLSAAAASAVPEPSARPRG